MTEILGINLRDCICGGRPVEAGPSELTWRVKCDTCGRTTQPNADLSDVLAEWNKIARRKCFWYCLICRDVYCPFPYASNEYLNTHLIHRSRVACKIHCWWLNMKEKLNGGKGKRNGYGGD